MLNEETCKLVARLQHFYDFMNQKKLSLQQDIILKDPAILHRVNLSYLDLEEEYFNLFKEFIYIGDE
jgi:hypothetical protein